jgi:hypothetical protein
MLLCIEAALCTWTLQKLLTSKNLSVQAKAEVDRMAQLQLDRSSLAFGSAMVRSSALRRACDSDMCMRTDEKHTPIPGQVDVAREVRMRQVHATEPQAACAGGHKSIGRRVRGAAAGAAA